MIEKILESGAILNIKTAPFATGTKLVKAVSRELLKVNIDIGLGKGRLEDFFSLEIDKDGAINTIKDLILNLISSDEIETIVWECLDRCTYTLEGAPAGRINRATFENDKAKGDYYLIVKEVLAENLTPFFPNLHSKLLTNIKIITSTPNVKSTLTNPQ